jgi:hypothetical protein
MDPRRGSLARTAPDQSRLNGDASPTSPTVEAGLLGGLDQRKNRGRLVVVSRNGGQQRVIDVSGDDQLATVTTISLATVMQSVPEALDPPPTEQTRMPVVAHIEWGTDGGMGIADLDLVRGTVVQVPSSSVRVQVGFDPEYATAAFADVAWYPALGVVGSIGYMPSARGAAQRTLIGQVGEGVEFRRLVPQFARRVRFVRSTVATALAIELISAGVVFATLAAIDPTLEIPIPNWCTEIRVTSATAGNLSAVFELWI